jgi:thiol-disulfide isomerase/thioredoxin
MNKVIGGVIVLAIVVIGGWWYMSDQAAMKEKAMTEEKAMIEKVATDKATMEKKTMMEKEAATKQPENMEKKTDTMTEKKTETAMMIKGGQYIPYDASKIAFAKEGKVVLFFRASWCPTCRALDTDIKANLSQIPSNVLILDVDYDKYTDLKKQYEVTYQHTMVQVDETGKQIFKFAGSATLKDFLMQVK